MKIMNNKLGKEKGCQFTSINVYITLSHALCAMAVYGFTSCASFSFFFPSRSSPSNTHALSYLVKQKIDESLLLLCRCQQSNNVVYTPGLVESISPRNEDLKAISVKDSAETWFAGMIVVAAGGMGGQKFIQYEQSSWPHVGAQTAYGIECEVGKLVW